MPTLTIIMGPTFSGKTTLLKNILTNNKDFQQLITNTTRPKRANEKNGIDYYFVSNQQYTADKQNDIAVAPRTYHVQSGDYWHYYINANRLKKLKNNTLMITDLQGYYDTFDYLKAHPEIKIKLQGFILSTNLMTIFKRVVSSSRNDENPRETLRRLYDDEFNVFNFNELDIQELKDKYNVQIKSPREILNTLMEENIND